MAATTTELSTVSIPLSPPWRLERGAQVLPGGGVRFSVWAPSQPGLQLELLGPSRQVLPMEHGGDGVSRLVVDDVGPGADYWFVTAEGARRPDPVSRFQPQGVHGPSRVVAPETFPWSDQDWHGLPLRDHIFYELHTGTFSPDGTFDGVAARLPHLKDLGVTAVELMPVATFPGTRNWGYDGVALYAPHPAYGGPDGLRRLVDACHGHGLALVLDVVYNHLGPEGNYLGEYGPYFCRRYHTPWGDALNFDGPDSDEVRRFFVDNALAWIAEYHVDGLRLDAVHGIYDFSARHILAEIADRCHELGDRLGRSVHVIPESDLNDSRILRPHAQGGYATDAQWSDDFHHSLASLLTGNRLGYFGDFGSVAALGKSIAEGFVYDGRHSAYRRRRHGNSAADLPGEKLVIYAQNHDQIPNGFKGRRLGSLASVEEQKLAALVLFTAPNLPMLFMGQEYGEIAPFLYFTSHSDEALGRAVSEGRRREFLDFAEPDDLFDDPQDEKTAARSRLDWSRARLPPHDALLAFHRRLIALRRTVPALHNCRKDLTRVSSDDRAATLGIRRDDDGGSAATLLVNFAGAPRTMELQPDRAWHLALATHDPPPRGEGIAGGPVELPPRSAVLFVA